VANVQAIRAALANQLQTQLGIQAYTNMPPTVDPPMFAVLPGQPYISYGKTMGEMADALGATMGGVSLSSPLSKNDIQLQVLIIISLAQGYEESQPALDTLLEPSGNIGSVPTAIDVDPTLGGVVDYCITLDVATYGVIQLVAGQDYFGARLRVQVGA
jgi:hypothetical protein